MQQIKYYDVIKPKMSPREHQRNIVEKACKILEKESGIALFMDVGTGKTKTILDICAIYYSLGYIEGMVVIPPKSLVGTWIDQLATHCAVEYEVFVWDSTRANGVGYGKDFFRFSEIKNKLKVFIVNVEAFSKQNQRLGQFFDVLGLFYFFGIVDESTKIKGHSALRSINITGGNISRKKYEGIAKKLKYKAIMTGTEFTTSPLDIFQQFEFLKNGFFGYDKFYFFKLHYAKLVTKQLAGGRQYQDIVGYQNMDEMKEKITPITFRAKKDECLDLPDIVDEQIIVTMSLYQEKLYLDLKHSMYAMLENGELMTVENKMILFGKFRQICSGFIIDKGLVTLFEDDSPKLDALISELEDTQGQAIIWASYVKEIDIICDALEGNFGLDSFARYDGETDCPEEELKRFLSGQARFFVANPKKGGQGLNLQHNTSIQYFFSLPISLEEWLQARGRTHRDGQKNTCVYRVLLSRFSNGKKAVDDRVLSILLQNGDILNSFQRDKLADFINLV